MHLTAGPITLLYDNGFPRYFKLGDDEVLRRIYFALRNQDWDTARLTFSDESITKNPESFRVDYNWAADDLGMQMNGHVTIEGATDGTVTMSWYGKALNTFWRNRVGFCVLHPIDGVAGQPCHIQHPEGHESVGDFPRLIKPDQPFLNVQGMRWQTTAGHELQLSFTGDVFETEDQRNWSDTSYKTYCTPQDRPKPAQVEAGTELFQQIVFRPIAAGEGITAASFEYAVEPPAKPLRIGLGHNPYDGPLTAKEIDRLRAVGFSHLRTDVFLTNPAWKPAFDRAVADAVALALPLEVMLFFGDDPATELAGWLAEVAAQQVVLYTVAVFWEKNRLTDDTLLTEVAPALREALPGIWIGGGTDANFVDVNRNPFDYAQIDFVTYSINPQSHATDDLTVMENIGAQADTVRSARVLSGGKPVHVSAVTLKGRFNPDAALSSAPVAPPADHRQPTDFAAGWLAQSLQTLEKAGAGSVTYFETHGPRGLMDADGAFPVYEVLAAYHGIE